MLCPLAAPALDSNCIYNKEVVEKRIFVPNIVSGTDTILLMQKRGKEVGAVSDNFRLG